VEKRLGPIGLLADSRGDFEALTRGYETLKRYGPDIICFLGGLIQSGYSDSDKQSLKYLSEKKKEDEVWMIKGENEISFMDDLWKTNRELYESDDLELLRSACTDLNILSAKTKLRHFLSMNLEAKLDDKTIIDSFLYHMRPMIPKHPESGFQTLKNIIFSHTPTPCIYRINPKNKQIARIHPKANIPTKLDPEYLHCINIAALTDIEPKFSIPESNNIDSTILQSVCVYELEKDEITYIGINQ
jgi:hypothetical protein